MLERGSTKRATNPFELAMDAIRRSMWRLICAWRRIHSKGSRTRSDLEIVLASVLEALGMTDPLDARVIRLVYLVGWELASRSLRTLTGATWRLEAAGPDSREIRTALVALASRHRPLADRARTLEWEEALAAASVARAAATLGSVALTRLVLRTAPVDWSVPIWRARPMLDLVSFAKTIELIGAE